MSPLELRRRRRALGLTQKQLGVRLGVGELYIGRREAGTRPITRMLAIAVICLSEHPGR